MKIRSLIVLFVTIFVGTSTMIGQVGSSDIKVSGTVVSALTGNVLAGARLTLEGAKPVMTEDKGAFTLIVTERKENGAARILQVSAPGYATRKLYITGSKNLIVKMYEEGYKGVETMVMTPFGLESTLNSTYAVNSASPGVSSSIAATPDGLLQGTVAGLNAVSRSGQVASGVNMFLQGFNSLVATSQPMIVVDGVPFDNYGFKSLISGYQSNPLSSIDVKDIENITVLKDGSGLYGGKASNGVILINSLKATDAATKIYATVNTGMSFTPLDLPLLNATQYKSYLSDLLLTSGKTASEIQALPYFNQDKPVADKYGRYSGNSDFYRYANNTNWQSMAYEMARNQDYYINIKGGDQTALYAVSMGYLVQDGILSNTNYTRFNTRFNSDINISKKFQAHTNMSFSYGTRYMQNEGAGSTSNLLYNSLVKAPITGVSTFNLEGLPSPNLEAADVFGVSNVKALADNLVLRNLNYRFNGSLGFDYDFNRNLKLTGLFGLNFNKDRERVFLPSEGVAHDTLANAVVTNESKHRVERWFVLYSDAHLSYTKKFNAESSLTAHAGMRYQNSKTENDFALAYNSASDNFKSIGYGDANLRKIGGSLGEQNWMSFYGNADYVFANKYIASAILTADLSSRYTGVKVFPTISAAWLVSSEDFMSDVNAVNFLKVRASIGKTGNDDIGNYQQKKYYTSEGFLGYNGLVLGNIPNSKLRPEITTKINLGVDAAFMDDRMHLSLDVYSHNIEDMITYSAAPAFSGFTSYLSNGGSMTNKGIDLSVYGRVISGEINWDLGLNISKYKNNVTRLDCGTLETVINGATVQTKVGQPIGVFYGYKTNGIYATQAEAEAAGLYIMNGAIQKPFTGGDVRFVNQDASKEINSADRVVIGDPNPDVYGAILSTVTFNNFTLDAKIGYSIGGDLYNYTRAALESMSGYENQTLSVLNRWRADGQVTSVPKATWGDPMGNSRFSDRWIEDGSYMRLKTITLNYKVPMQSKFIESINVFMTGENLLTLTKYKGLDPEFSQSENPLYYGVDAAICPQPVAVFLGVKIGL